MTSIPMLAGGPKVIANPSVKADAISVMELKAVFLEERNTLGDGSHVSPVLEKSGAAHAAFLREFLEQNDDNLQTHYRSLAFTGTGFIPKALESDKDVVVYVAKTRGAIGYVDSETNTRGVKTLTILRPNGGERALLVRVAPDYPDALQKRSIGGIVRLEITISSEGTVESARLLGGNPILAESAMDAVKGWKYSSARSRSNMEVTIPFNPSD
ncbi:MAG TPA: TonB family protein [Terriglobales bacterium]